VEGVRLARQGSQGLLKVRTPTLGSPPSVGELLERFRERFPGVEVDVLPSLVVQTIEALKRRVADVAIVSVPFEPTAVLRYLRLGVIEMLVAIPTGHRLARLDRIPRSAILEETFLDWPRNSNPTYVDHLHRMLFGGAEHPRSVEVLEYVEANRLLMVAEGRGLAVTLSPTALELGIQGVVLRRMEDPVPVVEYGLLWTDMPVSTFVQAFVDLAKELGPGSDSPTALADRSG